jgi:dTDP-glucose 4,6-dehydratase
LNNTQITKLLLKIASKNLTLNSKVQIKYIKDRPGHDLRYALNSNKIRKELKWKPRTSLNAGLTKTLQWYLDNKEYFNTLKKKDIIKRLGI